MSKSRLEQEFCDLWEMLFPEIDLFSEYRFYPKRRFRFDFASVEARVAIELDGAIWSNGRHNRGSGYLKDCEKFNLAASEGWLVFRLTDAMITPEWLNLIAKTIQERKAILVHFQAIH